MHINRKQCFALSTELNLPREQGLFQAQGRKVCSSISARRLSKREPLIREKSTSHLEHKTPKRSDRIKRNKHEMKRGKEDKLTDETERTTTI
jgi:hypothetical protein